MYISNQINFNGDLSILLSLYSVHCEMIKGNKSDVADVILAKKEQYVIHHMVDCTLPEEEEESIPDNQISDSKKVAF